MSGVRAEAEKTEQEQFFLSSLESATTYQITPDGFLEIEYRTGLRSSETLFFVAGQADLQNTQWVLQALGDPEDLQSVEAATTVTSTALAGDARSVVRHRVSAAAPIRRDDDVMDDVYRTWPSIQMVSGSRRAQSRRSTRLRRRR